MDSLFITALIQQHRAVEAGIDRLAQAIRFGNIQAGPIRELVELIARHYSTEEQFLAACGADDPKLASKLRAQHDEAAELAQRLLESLEGENAAEIVYLSRRFMAIAQHNIIEEERDLFPLAERVRASE